MLSMNTSVAVTGNLRHDLERISETHEPRARPVMSQVPEGQRAIVEADAVPEPRAAMVERNRRYEDRVEESRVQVLVAVGLMHSERVLRAAAAELHESHGARAQ